MPLLLLLLLTALLGLAIAVGLVSARPWRTGWRFNPAVVVIGPSDGGKTTLVDQLERMSGEEGEPRPAGEAATVMLMQLRTVLMAYPLTAPRQKQKFDLVDFPGHPALQQLMLARLRESLGALRGVVVVVDATWLKADLDRLCSEFLVPVLKTTESRAGGVDVLFAVNKTDLFNAQSVARIRQAVEDGLRQAVHDDKHQVLGSGEDALSTAVPSFALDELEGNMDFVGGSALKGDVSLWMDWIDERLMNPI